jgi:hypothetical protein
LDISSPAWRFSASLRVWDRKDLAILKALLSTIEENGADAVLLFLFSGVSLESEPV